MATVEDYARVINDLKAYRHGIDYAIKIVQQCRAGLIRQQAETRIEQDVCVVDLSRAPVLESLLAQNAKAEALG